MQKIQKFQFGRLYAAPKSFKTDGTGAFEEILCMDGIRLRGDTPCPEPKRAGQKLSVSEENLPS